MNTIKNTFLTVLLAWGSSSAGAVDVSWSGYGTLGYTRTDSTLTFDRFANDQGTLKRDSVLGLQANAEFNPQWSLTLQAVAAPSLSDVSTLEATLPWAYVSWRPSNSLLLRAGKMRMPMYVYSENMNVGASFEFMHLPTEVYSTAPTTDYTGASFTKTWELEAGELALDGYAGNTSVKPTAGQSGSLQTRSSGLMLNLHRDEDVYRAGVQQAYISVPPFDAIPLNGTGSAPANGISLGQIGEIDTRVFLLGADIALGNNHRLIAEVARRYARNLVTPKNSTGGYIALLKKIDRWTPYVMAARLLSDDNTRQPSAAGETDYDDQLSLAVGASYALSPRSKLKGEWMRVYVGGGSTMFDHLASGATVSNQDINVFSLSYSFAF